MVPRDADGIVLQTKESGTAKDGRTRISLFFDRVTVKGGGTQKSVSQKINDDHVLNGEIVLTFSSYELDGIGDSYETVNTGIYVDPSKP